ncbi:hypothetical protein M6B38_256900 [Iris pallida]|uniref:Uncharacterized protein n=1 Tax=Iris pallida TaxID=29817 RepID=A0AAX6IFK9_IRIPA|nr:hypothetical protein M6B38_256900 [Iris pallida]
MKTSLIPTIVLRRFIISNSARLVQVINLQATGKNGDEAILALVAQVKEREMSESFNIYTNGFYSREDRSSRQGAVLRDCHNMPIAAWSSIDSDVERISTLHNELKGLSLGLKMAIQYQVTNFYIHTPCPVILYILGERICYCGEENSHTCRKCFLPKVWGKEETFQLLLEIFPLIEQFNFSCHNLRYIDDEDNKVAHCMAELGEDRKWTCRKSRSTRVYRRFSTQMCLSALMTAVLSCARMQNWWVLDRRW